MTYKQIETSREIRQWIGIAASSALAVATLDKAYPELRYKLGRFGKNLKKKTVTLFKKER